MWKKIVVVLALIFALVAMAAIFWRPRVEAQVVGTVSAEDLKAIKQVVNREIWRGVCPDLTWRSLKRLPSNLGFRPVAHIERVNAESKPFVLVTVGYEKPDASNAAPSTHLVYFMKQDKSGWKVISISPIFGTLRQSSPDGTSPFHSAPDILPLSNRGFK